MTQEPLLWPIPQETKLRDDALSLSNAALVVPPQARDSETAPAQLFADLVMDDFGVIVPVVRGEAPAGKMPVRIRAAGQRGGGRTPGSVPSQAEGYLLKVTAQGAEAVGRDARGAQHAAATMIQLVERRGNDVVLRGAQIRDWPHKPVRMVHLYLPGADHLSYARRYLRDFLVRYKFNGLFVELGGGARLRQRPEIALGWRRFVEELRAIDDTGPIYGEHVPLGPGRRFSASVHTHLADGRYIEPGELVQLCDWARDYQLDLVPEIQSLSHCYYLACAHPEIAEIPEADFPDSYCPCDPRSYDLLFEVMDAYVRLTKCRSVHIGHDEWRAAGVCPKCQARDTGEMFGEDVVKIASWLVERGLGVWMWGDHLIPKHNAVGRRHDNGQVVYDHPDTQRAAEIMRKGAPQITMLNWSWWLGAPDAEHVLADLGYRQIYGNFDGRRFPDWAGRSAHPSVLGAEISSWCAWEDFELGLIHYPPAMYSANLLWSNHWPEPERADEAAALQLPRLRDRMRRSWEKPHLWSVAAKPERKHIVSIKGACNAPLKADGWDLSGLRVGQSEYDGIPYEIADGAVVVERAHKPAGEYPYQSAAIPVGGKYGSLIFWQVATSKGGDAGHAGDGTNHPREAAELLGWYEILYADGLTRSAEIRYHENVLAWDSGHGLLYYAREIPAGKLLGAQASRLLPPGTPPADTPLVIWGLEWTNPRSAVPIVSVTLHGARSVSELRWSDGVSDARPMLLGITAVETPKWEDYRPGKKGKLPGFD